MEIHNNVGKVHQTNKTNKVQGTKSYDDTSKSSDAKKSQGDSVSVSSEAQLLSSLSQIPDVREDTIEEIRDAIEKGTYLTDEKLDGALDKLLEDL